MRWKCMRWIGQSLRHSLSSRQARRMPNRPAHAGDIPKNGVDVRLDSAPAIPRRTLGLSVVEQTRRVAEVQAAINRERK